MNSEKIYIFDLDNTLIKTSATVKIKDENGNTIDSLDSNAYNALESGGTLNRVSYDYTEFRTLKQLMREEKTPLFDFMLEEYRKGSEIYIITARPIQHTIWKWLSKNKVYLDKRHIMCYDYTKCENVSKFKALSFGKILKKYEGIGLHIYVYEDTQDYIEAMRQYHHANYPIECRDINYYNIQWDDRGLIVKGSGF